MIRIPRKRVLVPTDFTDQSDQAIREAFDMVEEPGDVTVLHVAPPLEAYAVADPAIVWEAISDDARRKKLEQSFRTRGDEPWRVEVDFQVVFGYPVEEISSFAEKHHFDMILMPSHGRHGIQRLLLGSVAERVVRSAHCPVMVLRD